MKGARVENNGPGMLSIFPTSVKTAIIPLKPENTTYLFLFGQNI